MKRLKQQFPKQTGLPVYAWLQEARLQKAKLLLINGENSVTQVSLAVGYSSLSHFSALFRRRFGASPSSLQGKRPGRTRGFAGMKRGHQSR
ncbi:helix-turn-helix transcriptional regulator [Paracoccus sp. (in: a-proteobacteria)]|uniref:helix-turn-helix transcriptional regulator n=1 Tax=Paracoccus sp. TaxID=267 RepID=UPI002AFEDE9B|nr:helix-turn-helix transcriptional regulator [Paracoccus sp. (in: a-proteobacteria)]